MYYLERHPNEKLYVWAHRVYNRQRSIINKIPEKYDIDVEWYASCGWLTSPDKTANN